MEHDAVMASLDEMLFLGDNDASATAAAALRMPVLTDISFPPSSPRSLQPHCTMMPHAPSPSIHLEPIHSAVATAVAPSSTSRLGSKAKSKKATSAAAAAATSSALAKLSDAKQLLTLDDVEREILRHNAHLPPDAKRRMVKAEFKRLKHCETVRQSRVRKKAERKDLRQVNDELEIVLNKALDDFRARNNWMEFDERSLRDVMFKKFAHSIYEVRGLRAESTDIKDRLMVYDTLGEHFQRLQSDFSIPDYVRFQHSFGTIHFEPLTDAEARAIMLDSHHQALSFFETMRRLALSEHEKTMGWTQHQRITTDGRVQFNFTKRIATIGAEELVEKSWAMYCDFELYHGIYASVQKLEILQTINEDTLLIRRDLQEGATAPIFRTIFLLFRIKLERGYLICFRSHNPRVYVDDDADPNVQWMDMFYWLLITDPVDNDEVDMGSPDYVHNQYRQQAASATTSMWSNSDGHSEQHKRLGCDVTFGGNLLDHKSAQHAVRWKYQIAMALLRWESNAVAPLFALFG